MPYETDEDYDAQTEQIGSLSKNPVQTGKPVLWTTGRNLDKLPETCSSRYRI